MMIGVPEKYALEVRSPTSITSERRHEEYLAVLDQLASKENATKEEENYAEVLLTLNRGVRRRTLRHSGCVAG
jgi:hypothetical protein